MKKFVLICHPRTGSNLLMRGLSPYCEGEIFGHNKYRNINKALGFVCNQKPLEYLDFHLTRMRQPVAGAKVMFRQMDNSAIETILKSPDIHKVILYRENLLDTALSDKFAGMAWQWAISSERERQQPKAPKELSIKMLKDHCDLIVKETKWIKDTTTDNFIRISYNEMVMENGNIDVAAINKVRNYLGVNPFPPEWKPSIIKQAKEKLYEKWISNYNEIVKQLGPEYGQPFSREIPPIWGDIL